MRKMTRNLGLVVGGALLIGGSVGITSCSQKMQEPFRDAPTTGHDNAPAMIIEMPDGFSNLATKCDGHGHRLYVAFHGDGAYGAITAIGDPGCPGR